MGRTLAILAATLAACTVMDHQPVEGWPALQVVEHYVPHAEMRSRCARYVGFGMSPEACAEFDLVRRRCDIWYSADIPPSRFIVNHERLHCSGYDHIGSTNMQLLLQRHLASGAPGAGAGSSQ